MNPCSRGEKYSQRRKAEIAFWCNDEREWQYRVQSGKSAGVETALAQIIRFVEEAIGFQGTHSRLRGLASSWFVPAVIGAQSLLCLFGCS